MFATNPSTVEKWVLNRPFQSVNEQCGLDRTMTSPTKCLRPNEIEKSNKAAEKIMLVISHFLSPFDDDLNEENLYNLVSGMPVDEAVASCLTSVTKSGKSLMKNFVSRLEVGGCKESLTDTVKKFPLKNFEESTNHHKDFTIWQAEGSSNSEGHSRSIAVTFHQT